MSDYFVTGEENYYIDTGEEHDDLDSDSDENEDYGPEPEINSSSTTEVGDAPIFSQNPYHSGSDIAAKLPEASSALYALWCTDCRLWTEGTRDMMLLDIPIICRGCLNVARRVNHAVPSRSGNDGQGTGVLVCREPARGSGGDDSAASNSGCNNNGNDGGNATITAPASADAGTENVSGREEGERIEDGPPDGAGGNLQDNCMADNEKQAHEQPLGPDDD